MTGVSESDTTVTTVSATTAIGRRHKQNRSLLGERMLQQPSWWRCSTLSWHNQLLGLMWLLRSYKHRCPESTVNLAVTQKREYIELKLILPNEEQDVVLWHVHPIILDPTENATSSIVRSKFDLFQQPSMLNPEEDLSIIPYIAAYRRWLEEETKSADRSTKSPKRYFCVYTNVTFQDMRQPGNRGSLVSSLVDDIVRVNNVGMWTKLLGLELFLYRTANQTFIAALIELLSKGLVTPILHVRNFHPILRKILELSTIKRVMVVRFSKKFKTIDPELYEAVRAGCSKKNIPWSRITHVTTSEAIQLLTVVNTPPNDYTRIAIDPKLENLEYLDFQTITSFCKEFIIAYGQPHIHQLSELVSEECRLWVRSWLTPDQLAQLNRQSGKKTFDHDSSSETDEDRVLSSAQKTLTPLIRGCILRYTRSYRRDTMRRASCHPETPKHRTSIACSGTMLRKWARNRINTIGGGGNKSLETILPTIIKRKYDVLSMVGGDKDDLFQSMTQFTDTLLIEKLALSRPGMCCVIVGTPGIGKSITMQHLAFSVQKRNSTLHVDLRYGSQCQSRWLQQERLRKSTARRQQATTTPQMKKSWEKGRIVFIDAVNETPIELQDTMRQLIGLLRSAPDTRLVLSCRWSYRHQLDHYLLHNSDHPDGSESIIVRRQPPTVVVDEGGDVGAANASASTSAIPTPIKLPTPVMVSVLLLPIDECAEWQNYLFRSWVQRNVDNSVLPDDGAKWQYISQLIKSLCVLMDDTEDRPKTLPPLSSPSVLSFIEESFYFPQSVQSPHGTKTMPMSQEGGDEATIIVNVLSFLKYSIDRLLSMEINATIKRGTIPETRNHPHHHYILLFRYYQSLACIELFPRDSCLWVFLKTYSNRTAIDSGYGTDTSFVLRKGTSGPKRNKGRKCDDGNSSTVSVVSSAVEKSTATTTTTLEEESTAQDDNDTNADGSFTGTTNGPSTPPNNNADEAINDGVDSARTLPEIAPSYSDDESFYDFCQRQYTTRPSYQTKSTITDELNTDESAKSKFIHPEYRYYFVATTLFDHVRHSRIVYCLPELLAILNHHKTLRMFFMAMIKLLPANHQLTPSHFVERDECDIRTAHEQQTESIDLTQEDTRYVIAEYHYAMVLKLIHQQAVVFSQNNLILLQGALHYAACTNEITRIDLLLTEGGLPADTRNENGKTTLHVHLTENTSLPTVAITRRLINSGASLTVTDYIKQNTALHWAAQTPAAKLPIDIPLLLIQHTPTKISRQQNGEGHTPTMLAIRAENCTLTRLLLHREFAGNVPHLVTRLRYLDNLLNAATQKNLTHSMRVLRSLYAMGVQYSSQPSVVASPCSGSFVGVTDNELGDGCNIDDVGMLTDNDSELNFELENLYSKRNLHQKSKDDMNGDFTDGSSSSSEIPTENEEQKRRKLDQEYPLFSFDVLPPSFL